MDIVGWGTAALRDLETAKVREKTRTMQEAQMHRCTNEEKGPKAQAWHHIDGRRKRAKLSDKMLGLVDSEYVVVHYLNLGC